MSKAALDFVKGKNYECNNNPPHTRRSINFCCLLNYIEKHTVCKLLQKGIRKNNKDLTCWYHGGTFDRKCQC